MNEKKRSRVIAAAILAGTVLVLVGGVHLYSRTVVRLIEKDTEHMLEEASARGSALVEEEVRSNFILLHSMADAISGSGELWSDENMEMLRRQYERNRDTMARFLIVSKDGMARTSDGLEGYMGDDEIFKETMRKGEIISGVVPSAVDPDKQVIVLSVQVRQDSEIIGSVACVYNINKYERMLNKSILGGDSYSYVIESNGNAVIWPTEGTNPLGVSKDSRFDDQPFLGEHPYLSLLSGDMKQGFKGVHKFRSSQGGDYYMVYRPMGINGWYYVDVVPTDAVNQKAHYATGIIGLVSMMTVLVLLAMASVYGVSSYRHKKAQRRLVTHDRLTGILNWTHFKETFTELPPGRYAYVFFYLNDFLYLNNTFGYDVGGRILKSIASVVEQFIEKEEYGARLSENYFALYLRHGDEVQFKNRVNNLFTLLEKIVVQDDSVVYDYRCTYSGGVCLIGEEEKGEGFEQLNSKMDTIAESSAASHKTGWSYFDEADRKEIGLRRNLSADIYRALKEHQFVPYFQPLYELDSKSICQAEVLVRWNHPEKGLLYPRTFLKILEASGCILEMDLIMLDEACRCLHHWMENGLLPVPLTFNISGLNIYRQDFVSSLCAIPMKYKIPASLITLELPENIVFENMEKCLSVARELKEKGFRLSIDNFGTGTGSFKLLTSVPFDTIKIHSSFLLTAVSDKRSSFVVEKVVQMAASLGIKVVGSGVETEEVEACIKQLGCSVGQGYLYARPKSAQEFEQLLNEENTWG